MIPEDKPDNPQRIPAARRPHFPPSYHVHIAPTRILHGTSTWSGPDHWITQGYELRRLISMLYGMAATRIELLALDPNARYDVALVLPHEEDNAVLLGRIQTELERDLQDGQFKRDE